LNKNRGQRPIFKGLKSMSIYEERLPLDLDTVCGVHKMKYFDQGL